MIIPTGYAHIGLEFEGFTFEHNPFVTFGVQNTLDDGAAEIASSIEVACKALTTAFCHVTTSLVAIHAKRGPNATGAQATLSLDHPGTVGGDPGMPNTAYLCEKQTALGGRQGRGRFYMPGISRSVVGDDGSIAPVNVGLFDTALDDFLEDLALADLPMVLLHNNSVTPTPVSGLVVDGKVATQRRRLR